MTDQTISVISVDHPQAPPRSKDRGGLDVVKRMLGYRTEVPANDLAANLSEFLGTMGSIVDRLPTALGAFELKEMEIALEVSATGRVSLLGSGIDLSGKSGLTLTLKKRDASAAPAEE
ncbi:MAG: hypothetical protein JO276_01925 [Sphingomonadaceae bacterium]|nr:hypothetical protein [Sphingomonadaceae bacterium]